MPRRPPACSRRHSRAAAIAYADGQLDPAFNGGAPRVGTNAQGLAWSTQSLRVPAVVQADGRIVVAGQRDGAMTLARFNANGTLDTTYGTSGFVSATLRRHADQPARRVGGDRARARPLRRRARDRLRRLAVDRRRALLARRRR